MSLVSLLLSSRLPFFFFNDTATTEIYTLSLHDALPISSCTMWRNRVSSTILAKSDPGNGTILAKKGNSWAKRSFWRCLRDRKSTRLNSSHDQISYAVFCLKKKSARPHTVRSDADSRQAC